MAGTSKSFVDLEFDDENLYLPDNNSGDIDPVEHRQSNSNWGASTINLIDDNITKNPVGGGGDGSLEYSIDPTSGWDSSPIHDLKLATKKYVDENGGIQNVSTGVDGLAIEGAASASQGGVAIGNNASGGSGLTTIAIGDSSQATGTRGIAIGYNASAEDGIAIGISSSSTGGGNAFGSSALANGTLASAFGAGAQATTSNASALGSSSVATGERSISIGNSTVGGSRAIGIGDNVTTAQIDSVAIGSNITLSGANAYVIGRGNNAGSNGISIGFAAGGTTGTLGGDAISIGRDTNGAAANIGNFSISFGSYVDTPAAGGITYGYGISVVSRLVNSTADSFAYGWGENTPSWLYSKAGQWLVSNLPTFADDAAAGAGGVAAQEIYKTATGELRIKL